MENQTPALEHVDVDASATDGGGDHLSVIVPCYSETASVMSPTRLAARLALKTNVEEKDALAVT